jgi:hypothetical protein
MLSINQDLQLASAFMCSDRWLQFYLSDGHQVQDKAYQASVKQLAIQAYRDHHFYQAHQQRRNDEAYALQQWHPNLGVLPTMHDAIGWLKKLSYQYLHWRGCYFEVEYDHYQDWLTFISKIDPSWIIAIRYFELLEHQVLTVEQALHCLSNQCPLALPKNDTHLEVADNHVHQGGHGDSSLSLLDCALYLKPFKAKTSLSFTYQPEFTFLNQNKGRHVQLIRIFNQLAQKQIGLILGISNDSTEQIQFDSSEPWLQRNINIEMLNEHLFDKPEQTLLYAAYKNETLDYPQQWMALLISFLYEPASQTESIDRMRLSFLHASQIFRQYMVHSGLGLSQFVEYFGFKFRKPSTGVISYTAHAQNQDLDHVTLREFRVSPNVVIPQKKNSLPLIKSLKKWIQKDKSDQIHLVVHFSRSRQCSDRRFHKDRSKLKVQHQKLLEFFKSYTWQHYEILNAQNLIQGICRIPNVIRGFDVAGDENLLPIEVFAPTMRVLRKMYYSSNFEHEQRHKHPFITIHAGEDFQHIVSGMRVIDEAVQFCRYKAYDRIGHGLALGMLPQQWMEQQRLIYIPAREHLDNLVWLHHYTLQLVQCNTQFNAALSILAHKIKRWAGYIYQQDHSPYILYKAWLMRRNCPSYLTHEDKITNASSYNDKAYYPDFVDYEENEQDLSNFEQAKTLWQVYLADQPKQKNQRMDTILTISYSTSCSMTEGHKKHEDTLSPIELDLIEAIQDYLMEQYSKKKIVIEACPTSNIYIGAFNDYHEHPIFRWHPVTPEYLASGSKYNRFGIRQGQMLVCVNTDDAGIMPTTIQNEYEILEKTAIQKFNIGAVQAQNWINNIQQFSVNLFKRNHLQWYFPMQDTHSLTKQNTINLTHQQQSSLQLVTTPIT